MHFIFTFYKNAQLPNLETSKKSDLIVFFNCDSIVVWLYV